jgi:hypothetical protein
MFLSLDPKLEVVGKAENGEEALRITQPRLEPASRAVHDAGLVSFVASDDHLAEIEVDHASLGHSFDFRPALPLRFR